MREYQKRLKEVTTFFDNRDVILGYRKLMNCAMDTQNMDIYKDIIALTDWKEKNAEKEDVFIQKSKAIINKLYKFPIQSAIIEKPVVVANDLIKSYGKKSFKFGAVSLKINKGQVYGLVGENGNGKTTLLRLLAKELKADSGSLQFNFDEDYTNNYDLRTKLVYIPQRTQKWYGSLKDNLKFVLSNYGVSSLENETRILMMIARFGLWRYKDLKWSELSSGYKMRFELARTLLRQPELLLLDEPLANLDVLAQQVILEDLKAIGSSINNPVATILSSQQLYEVEKISDKVIFLKNGQYRTSTDKQQKDEGSQLIVEIDCNASREELMNVFGTIDIQKLIFNGGIYFTYFNITTSFAMVLKQLGENDVEVTYVRDISNSTRRFFVS